MICWFYFTFVLLEQIICKKEWTNFHKLFQNFCSEEEPLIYLLDNVNLYKGLPVHRRIFNRARTSTILNFTVKAVMKPNLNGIEWMLEDTSNFLESQGDNINKLEATDVNLGK